MTAERFLTWLLDLFGDHIRDLEKNSFKSGKNQESKPHKGYIAGAVHEAVVPDLHEPAWQHMLEDAPEKLKGTEGDISGAIAPGFARGKGDLPPLDGHNAAVGNGHPKDVGGEIFEGGLGIAHRLAVVVPGELPDLGGSMAGSREFFSIAALNLALKILASARTGR
jgi:hypothetical protein